jgi:hypothetical protein
MNVQEVLSPRDILVRNREKFRLLYEKVQANHEKVVAAGRSTIGHGFDHALMVAQYGVLVSETDRNADMAWVAGLMHNTDRHYEPEQVGTVVRHYLRIIASEFSDAELAIISDAVLCHSKRNEDSDSDVLKALMDADRLANCGPVNLFRCALHNHHLPAFVLETVALDGPAPTATFKKPGSCFDALYFNEEWRSYFRMPKAIALAGKHLDYLRQHQEDIIAQLEEAGLHPWQS